MYYIGAVSESEEIKNHNFSFTIFSQELFSAFLLFLAFFTFMFIENYVEVALSISNVELIVGLYFSST